MNQKNIIFILILVVVSAILGVFVYTSLIEINFFNQPVIQQPKTSGPPPVLPDPSKYSKEELTRLWANGERCLKKSFAVPSKPEDLVSTGGAEFLINEVEVNFIDDATCEDAERITLFLNGRITGFEPHTNLYSIEIPTRTLEALSAAIQKVKALNNPKIEGVFRSIVLPLGGN